MISSTLLPKSTVELWNIIQTEAIEVEQPKNGAEETVVIPSNTPKFPLSIVTPDEDHRIDIDLPQDNQYLPTALKSEMEDLYILFGMEGLDTMENAIDSMSEQPYIAPYQSQTEVVFKDELKKLKERAEKACADIVPVAANLALARLESSITEVLEESVRYLTGIESTNDAIKLFRLSPKVWDLKRTSDGGEANEMIKALVDLRDLRMTLELTSEKEKAILADRVQQEDPRSNVTTLSQGTHEFYYKKFPDLAQAKQTTDEKQELLTEAVIGYEIDFPIIHRLVATENLPVYPPRTQSFLEAPRGQSDLWGSLNDEIYIILLDTWKAATSLHKIIKDDPETIWEYPSAIEAALIQQGEEEMSFASRATEEKLKETRLKDWVDRLAMIAGGVELVALFFSPAPPVAAVIAGVSAVFSAGSTAFGIYENYKQSRASKATLDPTKSLGASESWGWFIASAAFDLLSLRGVKWRNIAERKLYKSLLVMGV